MFWSSILRTSRTTYRGSKGSGPGRSGKTSARSSPNSRATLSKAVEEGHVFKRAQRGLYDGSVPQTGNSIPKSIQKTLRTWKPNVQTKWLQSDILGKAIQARITTRAMRTIEKYGGLDLYLQKRKDRYLGEFGKNLRRQVAATAVLRAQSKDVGTQAS